MKPKNTFRVEFKTQLSAPRQEVWDVMGNTEHLNRVIKLPAVAVEAGRTDLMYRIVVGKIAFFKTRWMEMPFQWVKGRNYSVRREFLNGPIKSALIGIECRDSGRGSELTVFADVTPRFVGVTLFLKLFARRALKRMLRYAEAYDFNVKACLIDPTPRALVDIHVEEKLNAVFNSHRENAPTNEALWSQFTILLSEGTDEEVLRIRPLRLAELWNQDPKEVLSLFFWCANNQILELNWVLLCPNCQTSQKSVQNLKALDSQFHCDFCAIDFSSELDTNTELTFSIAPQLRHAIDSTYCLGSPMRMPHILAQQALSPGASCTVTVPLSNQDFRARVLKKNQNCRFVCGDEDAIERADQSVTLTYNGEHWSPEAILFREGEVTLTLKNTGREEVVVAIETISISPHILTAAAASRFPEFKTLFSSEVLGAGIKVSVKSLCLLFTDLKGSTQMYEEIGDASAFGVVRRHFDFLEEHIKAHEGSVVKTIGDAVMAAFPSPEHAMKAAMGMQAEVAEFSRVNKFRDEIVLKIGIHAGPAITMTANNQLDYFGKTVNLAARIQNESRGGDIVFSREMLLDPNFEGIANSGEIEEKSVSLKGVPEKVTLCYWTPARARAKRAA